MSKRLSDADVLAIRAATGSQKALAARMGVSQATVSRIKRGLARRQVEDDMTESTQPAVEGGIIEPSAPESAPMAQSPTGDRRVMGLSPKSVHLGDGRKLGHGDILPVRADLADMLVARGQARDV